MMAMRWWQQQRPCMNIEVRGNPESTVHEKTSNAMESNHKNRDWGPMI